ncbi:MAG: Hpt domain-containing protein [Ardenticatenaceae bacterium]|nr:Hpt domain-containing protein [Ardenticatenaceae bacterium]MCB9443297.1 Hpt domain-containing protein [Ardenticatenaceae bacterium]
MSQSYAVSSIEEIKTKMLAELQESMGDIAESLLPELAPMLLEDAPEMLKSLSLAIRAGNGAKVKELAHTLKGSCASMGIVGLAAICQDIENMGKMNEMANAPDRLDDAYAEYKQVKLVLGRYVE